MRRLAIVVALLAAGAATAAPAPRVPGATMRASCAGAGPFWPTQTLAVTPGAAWVACKEESRLVRVDARDGQAALGAARRAADRRPRRPRRGVDARHVGQRRSPRSAQDASDGPDPDRIVAAVQPLGRCGLPLVGRRRERRGREARSRAAARRRQDRRRRRPVGHGLLRGASLGDQPPRSGPRPHRHGNEPRSAPRDGARRCAGASRAPRAARCGRRVAARI